MREERLTARGNPCRGGENVTKLAAGTAGPKTQNAKGPRRGMKDGGSANDRATAIWQRLLWLSLRSVGSKRGAARRETAEPRRRR